MKRADGQWSKAEQVLLLHDWLLIIINLQYIHARQSKWILQRSGGTARGRSDGADRTLRPDSAKPWRNGKVSSWGKSIVDINASSKFLMPLNSLCYSSLCTAPNGPWTLGWPEDSPEFKRPNIEWAWQRLILRVGLAGSGGQPVWNKQATTHHILTH